MPYQRHDVYGSLIIFFMLEVPIINHEYQRLEHLPPPHTHHTYDSLNDWMMDQTVKSLLYNLIPPNQCKYFVVTVGVLKAQ